jgi:hypothetical protein
MMTCDGVRWERCADDGQTYGLDQSRDNAPLRHRQTSACTAYGDVDDELQPPVLCHLQDQYPALRAIRVLVIKIRRSNNETLSITARAIVEFAANDRLHELIFFQLVRVELLKRDLVHQFEAADDFFLTSSERAFDASQTECFEVCRIGDASYCLIQKQVLDVCCALFVDDCDLQFVVRCNRDGITIRLE